MNNIPENVLRIFGGARPIEPVRNSNQVLIIAGVGLLLVTIILIAKNSNDENRKYQVTS